MKNNRLLGFSEFIKESAEPWRLEIRPGAEEGWTVVALVDGERVGELRFIESRFRRVLKATSVVVDPAWQGRGIASAMYSFAEDRLGKRFVRTDAVLTPDGRALWQSRGGQDLDTGLNK
jgi:GNAT superfamily N-acetyltransferase